MSRNHYQSCLRLVIPLRRQALQRGAWLSARSVQSASPFTRRLLTTASGVHSVDDDISRLLLSIAPDHPTSASPSAYDEYQSLAGTILDHVLPYEAYPEADRRAGLNRHNVLLVIHAAMNEEGRLDKHAMSSGFLVGARMPGREELETLIISCAHTMEQLEHQCPKAPKRSFITVPGPFGSMELVSFETITASPRTDLIVGRIRGTMTHRYPRTLPMSPYPVYRGQDVLLHVFDGPLDHDFHVKEVTESTAELHTRRTWGRWVTGQVLGYRGFGWDEVEPGTSAAMPYILVSNLPTSGSSGGPIIDATSGAVVGMISGRRLDNRVEKERGWGSSAESIFEVSDVLLAAHDGVWGG